jgi:hypothetical protein
VFGIPGALHRDPRAGALDVAKIVGVQLDILGSQALDGAESQLEQKSVYCCFRENRRIARDAPGQREAAAEIRPGSDAMRK